MSDQETGPDTMPGRGASLALVLGMLLAGLLFLMGKNIASEGAVTLDQAELWIAGMVPFALVYAMARRLAGDLLAVRIVRRWMFTWIIILAGFIVMRARFITEAAELRLYEWLGYKSFVSHLLLSAFYVTAGYAVAAIIARLLLRDPVAMLPGPRAALVLLHFVAFCGLIYLLPPR